MLLIYYIVLLDISNPCTIASNNKNIDMFLVAELGRQLPDSNMVKTGLENVKHMSWLWDISEIFVNANMLCVYNVTLLLEIIWPWNPFQAID